MGKQWSTLEVLKYSRHHWMNKLQLIKGNLAINRIDRVKEIIDEMAREAKNESLLSSLPIPELAVFLITYNWKNSLIQVEYEVLGKDMESSRAVDDRKIAEWASSFLKTMETAVDECGEHKLLVEISPQQHGIRFFFDFRGIITKQQAVRDFLRQKAPFDFDLQELTDESILLEIYVPYAT